MSERLRVYITGEPGVGKTTLFLKVVKELENKGFKISGFYCPEVREKGIRIGFKIKSLDNEIEDWLASVNLRSNIRVGKYYVIINDSTIKKLYEKIEKANIIGIDEIGPMEFSIPSLKYLINYVLKEKKYVIAVVHRKISFKDGKNFVVTRDNRDQLPYQILNYIISSLNSLD
ncbi:NTPase [Sulfurisphaera javensis]|uniref:Nucleoside-triphosphatase SJAV_04980 n=1 Tax=Sulfurisphaera javensis TaxID=2049879 RepID=A0AAT9GPD1_9CREN